MGIERSDMGPNAPTSWLDGCIVSRTKILLTTKCMNSQDVPWTSIMQSACLWVAA